MEKHSFWMQQALDEAQKAFEKDEVPIGAIIVYSGKVIGKGHNLVETLQNPTAHAEINAINQAAQFLQTWRLNDTVLYVTLEPCAMCTGAILHARIPTVVFGAFDPRYGSCGTAIDLANDAKFDIKTNVIGGICETECRDLLKSFFRNVRQRNKERKQI